MGRRHLTETFQIRVKAPRPVFSLWPAMARRLRWAHRRILLCDFDGTLAAIRRLPDDARLSKATRRLLVRLRESGTILGIVSGRSLEDLEARVRLRGIWYIASHGYRLQPPEGEVILMATPDERKRVKRMGRWLARRLRGVPDVALDWKHSSLAVHYRAASPRNAERAEAIVKEALARDSLLRVIAGKKVWELLPGENVDKGIAVARLLKRERVSPRDIVAYLGDDTTDEAVFRRLKGGVGIVVGEKTQTAARYSLKSPGEVRTFLRRWLKASMPGADSDSRRAPSEIGEETPA